MADKEFNVKISAETDDFSNSLNKAEKDSSKFADALEKDIPKGAESATESLKETIEELRQLQREAIGVKTSFSTMNNEFKGTSSNSNKFNKEMQRLSMILGGDVPESTKKAYSEMYRLHEEARKASRYYGKYSQQVMNARDAITKFALGLDDTTFKQIYMRSQLGLTDMQLRQQANSIKLNARMTKLMGNQTKILTERMKGLQKYGIKPEDMLPPSTIGQFQLLNETMEASRSPLNGLSLGYRKLGGSVEKVIKNYSAQKVAIREAQGDMVKYGLLLRGITAANANMALAFPIVGMSALFAYKTMFSAALEADEGLKRLAETTKGKVLKALEPVIQTAGQFLKVALKVTGVVSDWIAKFNEAHPIIAKIAGVIGFLLPAMTLLLLPLQMGVGLWKGWMVALNGVWTMFGGVVTMIGTASSTFLAFAGILAIVGTAFIDLYKKNEEFRASISTLGTELMSAFSSIKETFVEFSTTISQTVQSMLVAITAFWNEHKDVIIPIVNFLWGIVKDTFLTAIDAIKNIVDGGLKFVGGIIDLFKAIAEGDFKAMWESIKTIFQGAIQLIIGFIQGWLVMGTVKLFKGLATGAKNLVNGMWSTIKTFFKNGITGCINFIKDLVKTGINNFNIFRTFGSNIFSALAQVIKSSMSKVANAVRTGMSNAVNYLKSINLFSIGKNIIQGLVNGVKSMASALIRSVKGVISSAIDGAKKLLGINSPSKLFRQFGEWTTEGYEIGINRGEPASTRVVEDFAENSINAFTTTALPSTSNNNNNSVDNSNYVININAGALNNEQDLYKLAEIIDRKLLEIKERKSKMFGGYQHAF
ncbi:hypothetical protein EAI30_13675 [Romboutsia ilealis]|uniref:Uncharacterized protein n=1 Tax=Romboutsia faecis TaxID=2764597 RepID=A0ABR7JST9_9FIRM|nr:hypothetical protein [Romboutsia faecis]MBC5997976.1 hypothetical protein [Romboutsia faecis]MRN25668.1 hypothetical protein [Romboutsia ilealis]